LDQYRGIRAIALIPEIGEGGMPEAVAAPESDVERRLAAVVNDQVFGNNCSILGQKSGDGRIIDLRLPDRYFKSIRSSFTSHPQAYSSIPDAYVIQNIICAAGPQPDGSPLAWDLRKPWFQPIPFKDDLFLQQDLIFTEGSCSLQGGAIGNDESAVLVEMYACSRVYFKSFS